MKIRHVILGTGIAATLSMVTALGVIGVSNNERSKLIDQKRDELNAAIYPVIPEESRTLTSPMGPALPSPGYEN